MHTNHGQHIFHKSPHRNLCGLFMFLWIPISTPCSWVETTLQKLSLDEKIGQLCMAALTMHPVNDTTSSALHEYASALRLIEKYHIGGFAIDGHNKGKPATVATTIRELQLYNQQQHAVPLLFGIDAEWGLTMRMDETVKFPYAIALGKIFSYDRLYAVGNSIGLQLAALGIGLLFAPVADIFTNPNNALIRKRSFGSTPEHVATCALAYMRGVQDAGVLACAKHFPGHGDTAVDTHSGLATLDHTYERLETVELYPFKKLIAAGIDCIMTGHIALSRVEGARPASLSRSITHDLLQATMGFTGLICTDALDMGGITTLYDPGTAAVSALQAGAHIMLYMPDIPAACHAIKEAITHKNLSIDVVDDRVRALLTAKEKLYKKFSPVPDSSLEAFQKAHEKAQALSEELYNTLYALLLTA